MVEKLSFTPRTHGPHVQVIQINGRKSAVLVPAGRAADLVALGVLVVCSVFSVYWCVVCVFCWPWEVVDLRSSY